MAMTSDSPFRSPLSYLTNPSPSPPRRPHPQQPPAPIVTWSEPSDPPPELPQDQIDTWSARADPPPSEAATAETAGSRSVGSILRGRRTVTAVKKVAIAVRVLAAALCMISFSVMAADKDKGWTIDSFDRYSEYRYCLSVNVIGFVYAAFQAFAEVHHMVHNEHIIGRPLGLYFDFAMDQILAYLLVSASSSASARTDYWVTNWGSDAFPSMIAGSVTMSFFAFIAFAISSFISAYKLFTPLTF